MKTAVGPRRKFTVSKQGRTVARALHDRGAVADDVSGEAAEDMTGAHEGGGGISPLSPMHDSAVHGGLLPLVIYCGEGQHFSAPPPLTPMGESPMEASSLEAMGEASRDAAEEAPGEAATGEARTGEAAMDGDHHDIPECTIP